LCTQLKSGFLYNFTDKEENSNDRFFLHQTHGFDKIGHEEEPNHPVNLVKFVEEPKLNRWNTLERENAEEEEKQELGR